jgi:cyclopropane fatty-acyl-phospholipid synthase-like methyltransferase
LSKSFDQVAENYFAARDRVANRRYLDRFLDHVAAGRAVLDLGCGAGLPIDEYLIANGRRVIGLDISEKQIELAWRNVPEGRFEVSNMSSLASGEYEVDGIVSFYAIFHTPRERHEELLRTLNSFLPMDGWLLITMGASEWEGVENDFHGGTMAWSHHGPPEESRDARKSRF